MKRKRKSTDNLLDDSQTCDLILTDSNGRSVRVHKALLIDKSDYFARVLKENNLDELQLDENYLIELIHYLYNHENNEDKHEEESTGDIEILLHLLALSKKYEFKQLYRHLMVEINYMMKPSTVLVVYRCATELAIDELRNATRIMILSWLPQLQKTDLFYSLSEESIEDIFTSESADVDRECKLNALSAWWSHNKEANMTNLWVKLISGGKSA